VHDGFVPGRIHDGGNHFDPCGACAVGMFSKVTVPDDHTRGIAHHDIDLAAKHRAHDSAGRKVITMEQRVIVFSDKWMALAHKRFFEPPWQERQ
jgi:hypothetical protein